jgi:hypothetical protein
MAIAHSSTQELQDIHEEVLSASLLDISNNLSTGLFEEAEICAVRAFQYAASLPDELLQAWRQSLSRHMYNLLPYHDASSWIDMAPGIAIKTDSFAARQIQAIAAVFHIIGLAEASTDTTILLNCMSQTHPENWLAIGEQCSEQGLHQHAARCVAFGIRRIESVHRDLSQMDQETRDLLLTLWFKRAQLFETLDRTGDAIAALKVYALLSADLAQQTSTDAKIADHLICKTQLESKEICSMSRSRRSPTINSH